MRIRNLPLAYVGLVLTALFWAGNAVVARATVGEIPPMALSFWRWVIALALLLPFGARDLITRRAVLRKHWLSIVMLAALSVGGFNTLLYLSAQSTGAINIALINSTIPVVIALFAWLLLGESTRPLQLAGIVLGVLGMLAIVGRGDWAAFAALRFYAGDLIMIGAVLIWGLYSVLLRRHAVPLPAAALLCALIIVGLPVILPFYIWELATIGGFELTWARLPFLVYVGVFPSVLAYLFWNHGVAEVGPARSGMFIYLTPVFAAVLATLFLAEPLEGFHALGGGLILAGLYLATRPARSLN